MQTPEAASGGPLSSNVLALLRLRESTAMAHWAARRLAELTGAREARVLRIFPATAARRMDGSAASACAVALDLEQGGEGPILELDELLAKSIRDAQVVQAADGARILVPLAAAGSVRYVLELHHGRLASPADALVPILNAYYDLLVDAESDTLTRLLNRRVLLGHLAAVQQRAAAGGLSRYVAIADIDHFKQINDRFGHLYGDEILIHFAGLMRQVFRSADSLYRFGGEEFVIVYGVEAQEHRAAPLERFRRAVETYAFPNVGKVTASIGFAAVGGMAPPTTLLDRADRAVYEAKRGGRNRICEYEALLAEGKAVSGPAEAGEATLF